jgi:hypothetical protein
MGAVLKPTSVIVPSTIASPPIVEESRKGISAVFQAKLQNIVAGKGITELRLANVKPASRAGGQNEQIKATLLSRDGREHQVRIKHSNSTEARTYQRIEAGSDPLMYFMPKFYGACDRHGVAIDPKKITDGSFQSDDIFIILGDLASTGDEISDFKFSKTPVLLRNQEELAKHHQTLCCKITIILMCYIRKLFSGFSFTSSPLKKGLFEIYSLFSFWKTRSVLKGHFKKLSREELKETIRDLKQMKKIFKMSHFTFSDASLLFISSRIHDTHKLKIHLIDMGHAIADDEQITNFGQVKRDAISSIDDLIQCAERA